MTVNIAYADSTDGFISSASTSYATARAGTGSMFVYPSDPTVVYGQELTGGSYAVAQAFLRWTFTVAAGEQVTTAALALPHTTVNGSVGRDLRVRQYAWAAPLTAASFRTSTQLAALPLLTYVGSAQAAAGKTAYAGSPDLLDLVISNPGNFGVVLTSSRAETGTAPTVSETSRIAATETAGTASDPALIFTTATRSTLFGVLGASVRLVDGSWAVLESDGAAVPTITLKRHTGSAATTIATIGTGFTAPAGAAAMALVTDGANGLHVIGASSTQTNGLALQYFAPNSTTAATSWTTTGAKRLLLPAYGGRVNSVAATYVRATTPVLAILAGHSADSGVVGSGGNETAFVTVAATYPDAGGAAVFPAYSAAALGAVLPTGTSAARFNTFANEIGNGLDLIPDAAGGAIGYLASLPKGTIPGETAPVPVSRVDLASDGTLATSTYRASSQSATKDAGTKIRLLPISTKTVVVVTADPATGAGITVQPWQTSASAWTALSPPVKLDAESLASMPTPTALAASSAWDAVYVGYENKVWVYYPDKTDPRILRRTGVSLSTYAASREERIVTTAGAAGGTNLAIRVQRHATVTTSALVTVAHKASGGTLSTIYVADSYAQPPNTPVLTPKDNYDATAAGVFAWTHSDPNGEAQAAYQLQIVNAGTLATVYDSGKVTSATQSHTLTAGTLTNGTAYQWRVRTYDPGDLVSAYSGYGTFSVAAGGTVTITIPATDNPAGVVTDSYTVQWSVAGTTQASRRVQLVRVSDSVSLLDTGFATSTSTSYTVDGMASDTEYEVRVTVRNASAVTSGTGTRRITPSYATPDVPALEVEDRGESDGYVLVSTSNVPPGAPPGGWPVYGFETDASGWTGVGGTVARSTAQAHSGVASLLLTPDGVTGVPEAWADPVAVTAGQQYQASVWVRCVTARSVQLYVKWRNATGGLISTTTTGLVAVAANTWTQLTITGSAPALCAQGLMVAGMTATPLATDLLYIDEATFSLASDRPVATGNTIFRREVGTAEWISQGTTAPDGQFRDYTARAGVAYEYKARAVAGTGYAESAVVPGSVTLLGVWLHDPADPTASLLNLTYGRSGRTSDLEVESQGSRYAGHVFPVVDFGPYESEAVQVRADVAHGPTWRSTLDALHAIVRRRVPLLYRDNRGRMMTGTLDAVRDQDADHGTVVSFTVTRTEG